MSGAFGLGSPDAQGPAAEESPIRNQRPLEEVLAEKLEDLDPLSQRAVLWREQGFDPDRTKVIRRENGDLEYHLRGAGHLPPFAHHESWAVRDAALMHDLMIDYLAHEHGSFCFNVVKWADELEVINWVSSINEAEGSDLSLDDVHVGKGAAAEHELKLWDEYGSTVELAADLSERWASDDFLVSLADEAFLGLLTSIAESAPDEPIHRDELIRQHGVLFFRERIDRSVFMVEEEEEDPLLIRAMSWFSDEEHLRIMLHEDALRDIVDRSGTRLHDQIRPYMRVMTICEIAFGEEVEYEDEQMLVNLMRSLLHLSQSPIIEAQKIQRKQKKSGRKRIARSPRSSDITCLSLRPIRREPSPGGTAAGHGPAERHMRRHMARGHWRNQWYPSLQTHRVIWIDEHWRGDADIGVVDGKKVYIARGD